MPAIGQLREFESPRVHRRKIRRDFFLWTNSLAEARERELATFDGNRQAVGMLNPMRDNKMKARTGGEKRRHLRPQLVQKLEIKSETKKKR